MFKRIFCLFMSLILCVGAVWADDFEDGNAAEGKADYVTALKKYNDAASRNDSRAQLRIGVLYEGGWGVVPDYAEAARWYRLAAIGGNAFAQYKLALMNDMGKGVVQDYAEAMRWYRLAAAQDMTDAKFMLGSSYLNRQNVAQDNVKAHMWLNLAAIADSHAAQTRNLLELRMTPQQIAEAQKLARECQARNFKNCD